MTPAPTTPDAVTPDRYCARCGAEQGARDHGACDVALTLEPPRYCTACRRRMIVQVHPLGWTATCSEHGTTTA